MSTITSATTNARPRRDGSASLTRYVSVVGRLLMGTIFLASGLSKVAAPAVTIGYIEAAGLPLPAAALVVAIAIEVGGSLLLIAGYQARLAALVLAVFSVVTAFAFHMAFADQNQLIHFFKDLAIAGGLLQVVAFGAGALSLDARTTRA